MKYEYTLLDSGNFKKLEQLGPYRMIRPCLQALWSPSQKNEWALSDYEFKRTKDGQGKWKKLKPKLPDQWLISLGEQKSLVKLTDFGHIGFFPEHHSHTKIIEETITSYQGKQLKVLNLFAYTGFLSLFLARLKTQVTHLDASKKSIEWAKENLRQSKIDTNLIRWITDDVLKFVAREKRRGSFYDGVILDPPSFGRGPKGEVWKIEEDLPVLLEEIISVLVKDFSFIILSSHSPGHTPLVLKNILSEHICFPDRIKSFELTVKEKKSKRLLPSGACALYIK